MPHPLRFVPLPGSAPLDGERIELAVPSPRYAVERATHLAALANNPFAIDTAVSKLPPRLTARASTLFGADERCLDASRVTLVVGYPFAEHHAVEIDAPTPSGFTRAELFDAIVRVHEAMFEAPSRFGGATHGLEQLWLERVVVERPVEGRAIVWVMLGS